MQKVHSLHEPITPEVLDLLEQRAAVQQWLARLDQQKGKVSDHVLQRVRDDYERRLQEALASLATHRRAIQEEMEHAAARLSAMETEHRSAHDELEEARLRNMIGELDDATWTEREVDLAEAVRVASEQETNARDETERLRVLLDQLEDQDPDAGRADSEVAVFPFESASEAEPDDKLDVEADFDDESDELSSELDEEEVTPPHGDTLKSEVLEDEAFLAGIDRQLNFSSEQPEGTELSWNPTAGDEKGADEETAPKPGLKCGECGYTNDLSAWFCGVCGADVG